ncbi:MAG TPA: hypothetical protein VHH36_05240 [Candidatus Thermoplasmatota archaeon]|nr:hypothetical protein [Candidatus Thermoplasmatota archaeon]
MNETYAEYPPEPQTSWRDQVERMGADRLLVVLGGVSALAFGSLALVLHLVGEGYAWARTFSGFTTLGGVVFTFALTLVFGFFLLLAYTQMERKPAEGAILALAFSIVLLVFGSTPGVIAGLLALVGSLVGIVRNLRFTT